jgi:alpha-N-arabinofuranosidase
VEKGTNPGFLYQQNTLRDALLAGTILNIFNKHCDRVKMANIAQLVNVLQALFLTEGEKMLLTPTYHVFDMYKVHQDATMLPVQFNAPAYEYKGKRIDALSVSASKDANGKIHLSLVNIDPDNAIEISCDMRGVEKGKLAAANIITAPKIDSHNTFENSNVVKLTGFTGATLKSGKLTLNIPAKSLVTVEIE